MMPKAAWPDWAAAEYGNIDEYLQRMQRAADRIMKNGVSGDMNMQEASKMLDQLATAAHLLELTCYRVNSERAGGERWPRWAIQALDKGPDLAAYIHDACLIGRDAIQLANFNQLAQVTREMLAKTAVYGRMFYGGVKPEVKIISGEDTSQ
jgi:hypothetical protein